MFIAEIYRRSDILPSGGHYRYSSSCYRARLSFDKVKMFAKEGNNSSILIGFNPQDLVVYDVEVQPGYRTSTDITKPIPVKIKVKSYADNFQDDFITSHKLDYEKGKIYRYINLKAKVEVFNVNLYSPDILKGEFIPINVANLTKTVIFIDMKGQEASRDIYNLW
jgi:hypothetical protein